MRESAVPARKNFRKRRHKQKHEKQLDSGRRAEQQKKEIQNWAVHQSASANIFTAAKAVEVRSADVNWCMCTLTLTLTLTHLTVV